MQVLVVAKPQFPIPPEELPSMIDGALEWSERYGKELKEFGLFPGGGGFGIVETRDTETLNRMILEMPFSRFSNHEVFPIVPGATGLNQFREAIADLAVV